jgi:hypothetical protein
MFFRRKIMKFFFYSFKINKIAAFPPPKRKKKKQIPFIKIKDFPLFFLLNEQLIA